ncbi:MAG: 23S rRNA (guanosine(2251)-2'-O)-methyltransferase RlmB [Candidatus Omnitrophica bacterium]|nr:23S rRNA (guanosine(2251)-2'-O)-methyltransferase RlmB [Candidatus Omnitrophota bacterium]
MRLYGKRSVLERLKVNPKSIKIIYLQEKLPRPEVAEIARKNKVKTETLSANRFFQLSQNNQAQGVLAEIGKFQYTDFDELIRRSQKATLIFLDRITDPQNLGVILRNTACFGGFAVVLPKYESVEVNETVMKVSCGSENYVPVSMVTNLSTALLSAKKEGYWAGAAVVDKGENPRKISLNFPLALLFGSEGEGIRPGLLKHADYRLTLPMHGAKLSFNVAMSVGIFCYEVFCQRNN